MTETDVNVPIGKEESVGVDSEKLIVQLANILEKIKGLLSRSTGEDLKVPSLKAIHSEIVNVQGDCEKAKLFKKGQELYSKWLEVATGEYQKDDDNGDEFKEAEQLIALAYNNRGYLKYLEVDFEGAIKDYTDALRYNPSLAEAYYNRGLVTYRLAFFQQSVEDMTKAVNLEPSTKEFQEGLMRVKEMIGSPNEHKFRLQM